MSAPDLGGWVRRHAETMAESDRADDRAEARRALREYLDSCEEEIEAQVPDYCRQYGVTEERARRELREELAEGWMDGAQAARTTDWDRGME